MTFNRRVGLGLLILVLYFLSRLSFLTKLPIFTDEAIYIRWGQIALGDPVHRFISLEDGKQPLFIWLMLPLLKFFDDPLLAGRLISVFSGFLTLAGLTVLGWLLFGEAVGWATAFLYLISPFFTLYDRLALYDSLTTMTMVWSMVFLILIVRKLRLDVALLAGLTIGAGLLTKSSAKFALVLLPTTLLMFDWKKKGQLKKLIRLGILGAVVVILSMGMELILRLGPLFHMIGLKNLEFIVTFDEFFAHPFERLVGNLSGLVSWLRGYLTASYAIFGGIGIFWGVREKKRETAFLLFWFLVPFLALASFAKILYPRFLLFMVAPLLPIVGVGVMWGIRKIGEMRGIWGKKLLFLLPFSFFLFPLRAAYLVVTDSLSMPIPGVDRFQLVDDWPSGYGIPEVVEFLRGEAKQGPLFVGTEGTFGLTPSALEIYLKDEKNIRIKGYWPIGSGIPEITEVAATGLPTYLLFKDTQTPEPLWPLELVAKYQKGRGNVFSSLYRVVPK